MDLQMLGLSIVVIVYSTLIWVTLKDILKELRELNRKK